MPGRPRRSNAARRLPSRPRSGLARAVRALRDAGWRDYSLFLRDDGTLIGYLEADDLARAQEAVAGTGVNPRWQAAMAELFQSYGAPDEAWDIVPEVFKLEDQLSRSAG